LHSPYIEEAEVEVGGDLADDLGFTDAAWSPDMQGHTLANERMKRFIELGGFHEMSLEVGVEAHEARETCSAVRWNGRWEDPAKIARREWL
jgi:hypothetical protein